MAFVVTGRVASVRESVNTNTGAHNWYVEIEDWGMRESITVSNPDFVKGVSEGAMVQAPCSVRAGVFGGQPRLMVRASEPFKIVPQRQQ